MARVKDELLRLKFLADHGRGEELVHVILVEEEARERERNQRQKTKFVMETHDPQLYSDFNAEKTRVIGKIVNKTVAYELLLRAWRELDDARIQAWLAEGEK